MSPLLLTLVVFAAAPVKAPPGASAVLFIPRFDALPKVTPFFEAAGSRSVALAPSSWREEPFPLLAVDVTHAESLTAAGIDPAGSLSASHLDDRTFACVSLVDPKVYGARVTEKLARLGTPYPVTVDGLTVTATRDSIERVLAAVVTRGKESCTLTGNGLTVDKHLGALVKALTEPFKAPMLKDLPGVVQLLSPAGAVGLTTKDLTLTADARLPKSDGVAALQGPGPSPLGAFTADGMLVVRARLAKSAMPGVLEQVLQRLPAMEGLRAASTKAGALLTGNAALLVSHVRVSSGLRTATARFFAMRFALLAETTDGDAVKGLLATIDPRSLQLREGTLDVAVVGNVVVLSNDAEAKKKAVAALETASGKQAHAVEFTVTPPLLAKGLAQVPLLEAVQTPELAPLLAISTEVGPLFLASERATGWLGDAAGGGHTAQLTWPLDRAKFAGDGGTP